MSTSLTKSAKRIITKLIKLLHEVKPGFVATESVIAIGRIASGVKRRIIDEKLRLFGISQYKMVGSYRYDTHFAKKKGRRKIRPNGREEKAETPKHGEKSFETAVHSQTIPDIQKLNCLFSCLKGEALKGVRGYDIAPENYQVIRKVLVEKFGVAFLKFGVKLGITIKKSLYNELHAIKKYGRNWKTVVEAIERILRQLEAIGENLEYSNIETAIESKLLGWKLNKVYQQKNDTRSVAKLRQFLGRLVKRNDQVIRNQASNTNSDRQLTKFNKRLQRSVQEETTALATISQSGSDEFKNISSLSIKKELDRSDKRRPCSFCNKDH
uniref:Transposase n=1 Tax=Loa loa TaxID=7209 RepID=A0A1I7VLA8_LOALO